MRDRIGYFGVLFAAFGLLGGPPANAVPASTRAYPSFYCVWQRLDRSPKNEPRAFAVFGERPKYGRPFPKVTLIDGETASVWIAVQRANGKWEKREADLIARPGARTIEAELDFLPVTILLPKRRPDPNAIYFARAFYGRPDEGRSYLCGPADLGLPGGAMSGGN